MAPNTIVSNCVKQGVRGKIFLSMCCKIEFTVPSCLTELRFCKIGLYGIQTFVINGEFLWKKNHGLIERLFWYGYWSTQSC